jgi:hypothetical protein
LSSKLHKFTFNEAFNAVTNQNLGYETVPILTWALDSSIPETATKTVDVSSAYKLTVQCGDWMYIKFVSRANNEFPESTFDVDVAAGTTGTNWTTGSSWSIGGGQAKYNHIGIDGLKTTNSVLTSGKMYSVSFDIGVIPDSNGEIKWEGIFAYFTHSMSDGMRHITNPGSYTMVGTPTDNTAFTFGPTQVDSGSSITVDNFTVREITLIDRDTDFAIPPGLHEIVVPRGTGNKIDFVVLPYNNYTEVLGSQYMRIIKHG